MSRRSNTPGRTKSGHAKSRHAKAAWAALFCAATLVVGACGSSAASSTPKVRAADDVAAVDNHTLQVAFLGEIGQPIDPDIYYGDEGEDVIDNVYDTLVRYKTGTAKPTIVGDLATSWSTSANGLTYTFALRKGVVFHDGTPFNCAAIGPDFARRLAVDQGPAYMVADVASVGCPNPYKAVITLEQPENDFLQTLASEYGPKMESPTELKANAGNDHDESWFTTHDAGSGPYRVVKADASVGYVLKYDPHYWGPKPYYTTIDISIVPDISTQELEIEQGKLDIMLEGLPARSISSFRANKKLAVHELPTEQGTFLGVNPHAPGLGTKQARKALLDAINPATIVATAYPDGAATVYDGVYPPHQMPKGLVAQKTSYRPGLLTKLAASLKGKTITIAYGTGLADDEEAADVMQSELAADGVHAVVISLTGAQFFSTVGKVTASPSLEISDPWPDASNPYTWAHIAYDPTGGLSYFQCPDPSATAALTKALAVPTAGAAQSLYKAAGEDYASTYCWEWVDSSNDVIVTQRALAGVADSHSVMAPHTLLFDDLHPNGA